MPGPLLQTKFYMPPARPNLISRPQLITKLMESRTEGWVAGLQLAAIAIQLPRSIQGEGDAAEMVAEFSGNDRHMAGYLLEEVLHCQPADRQRFLLETAVLDLNQVIFGKGRRRLCSKAGLTNYPRS